jgi:hypothetical protein
MTTEKVLTHYGDVSDNCSPLNTIVEVEIPEGYRRVWTGALRPGDLYLHFDGGQTDGWRPVKLPTAKQIKRGDPDSEAHWFGCVIRADGGPVQQPCERCSVSPRMRNGRFCRLCAGIVVLRARAEERR